MWNIKKAHVAIKPWSWTQAASGKFPCEPLMAEASAVLEVESVPWLTSERPWCQGAFQVEWWNFMRVCLFQCRSLFNSSYGFATLYRFKGINICTGQNVWDWSPFGILNLIFFPLPSISGLCPNRRWSRRRSKPVQISSAWTALIAVMTLSGSMRWVRRHPGSSSDRVSSFHHSCILFSVDSKLHCQHCRRSDTGYM